MEFLKAIWERILNFLTKKNRVKVPTILQMEATECGAASLSMILAHYKLWLPLEKLRQECGAAVKRTVTSGMLTD